MLQFEIKFEYKAKPVFAYVSKVENKNTQTYYFVEIEDCQKLNVPETVLLQLDHRNRLVFFFRGTEKKFVEEIAKQVLLYCQNNNIVLQ